MIGSTSQQSLVSLNDNSSLSESISDLQNSKGQNEGQNGEGQTSEVSNGPSQDQGQDEGQGQGQEEGQGQAQIVNVQVDSETSVTVVKLESPLPRKDDTSSVENGEAKTPLIKQNNNPGK